MSVTPPKPNDELPDDLLGHWCSEVVDGEPSREEFDEMLTAIQRTEEGRRELLLHLFLDSQLRSLLRGEGDSTDHLSA